MVKKSEQMTTIERFYSGLPVVDADKPLRVVVTQEDVEGAVPKDPSACAFTKACQRQFGSATTGALFFRTIAYVDHVDEGGTRKVFRYSLSPAARQNLARFDLGQEMNEGIFDLLPSTKTNRLDARKRGSKEYRERQRQRLDGETRRPRGNKYSKPTMTVNGEGIRTGTGSVHFRKEN